MTDMPRYALIREKMPREFLLLQGRGCGWKRCTFCDYHTDVSADPFAVNRPVLEQVTGEFGVLDVINSGSAMELDEETLQLIRQVADVQGIHTLWFESHWLYHKKLTAFARRFPNQTVKFRCGVETFDPLVRQSWNKGIPAHVTPEDIAAYFCGVCLLIGVEGQTRQEIRRDIELASKHFEYFNVNAFVENSTPLKRDQALVDWFSEELMPALSARPQVEILLQNTDLGVGL